MVGFLPAGFEELAKARDRYGAAPLGSWLAGGARRAFRMNHSGELFAVEPQFWRSEHAQETMKNGRLPDDKKLLYGGQLILVQMPAATHRAVTTDAPPSPPAKAPSAKKRGPKPDQLNRVKAEMRAFDRSVLDSMTEEAMVAQFKASRDTCRKARRELSGFPTK